MRILLTLTLSGSGLALLLLFLRYVALRRLPSTVYYYAWLLVLLRFALPLPGLIPTADQAHTAEPHVYIETPQQGTVTQSPARFLQNTPEDGQFTSPAEALPSLQQEEAAAAQSSAAPSRVSHSPDWRSPKLWLAVWAAGAVLSLGLTLFSYLRFTLRLGKELRTPDRSTRTLYASIPGRRPALYLADSIRTPMMFGVFAPKIVLPGREYEEELLLNILRHELTHYRRFDTLYKWLAVVILSAHWFNPMSWMIRRELNRACELSCDEMLLRSMTREEKQSYGNTLISMAAESALPAGVVATTFATEKRNLKERLVQIMYYRKGGARLVASVLALVLLTGCGMAAGPQAQKAEIEPDAPEGAVRVKNVDEFLAAIAPNATIWLDAGEYTLSNASDYGSDTHSSWYSWDGVWSESGEGSAELVISGVEGLTILGAGMGQTTLSAVPRYANVLRFVGCSGLTLSDLTAGHTTEPGFCSGGVVRLENCTDVRIDGCGLYGCGTIGVEAIGTSGLAVTGCQLYECSYYAVSLRQCRNVQVEGCEVYRHGVRAGQGSALALFNAAYSENVVIHGNRVHDNASQYLLQLSYTKDARFLSNEVSGNRFDSSVFQFEQYGATVDGCAFTDNGTIHNWVYSSGIYANDMTGRLLDASDFESMNLSEIDPATAVTPAPVNAAAEVEAGGEITAATVDEFLAAIGPDRTIILEGELFDLSTASSYGSVGGEYYYWQQSYDGPELVIQNVSNLSIQSASTLPSETTLAAIPRYANVLNFRNCENIFIGGFTCGHTEAPGSCSGGVLNFQNCRQIMVEKMRLYGCGILGVQASQCSSLRILRTEIYECSDGAGQFFQCNGLVFSDCDIHDVPSPALRFTECGDVTWNEASFSGENAMYDMDAKGSLVEFNLPHEDRQETSYVLVTPEP